MSDNEEIVWIFWDMGCHMTFYPNTEKEFVI